MHAIYGVLQLAWTCEPTCASDWPPFASLYTTSGFADLRVHLVRDLWCVTQFTNKLMMLFFLICSQVIKDLQVKTQYHRLIANSFVVVSITYSIFNCILCVVRCLSVLIIIGPSRLSITSWHMKNPDLLLSQGNTSLACNKPRVNSIKELQVYSTSQTLVFTNSHTYELNKSISKFPLQASNLYLQWYFVELNFFKSRFTCAIYNCKKSTIIVSLLSWPQICFGPSLCPGLSYFAE